MDDKKHMKRYSTPLIIREKQIKTTLRYHFTPARVAIINKSTNNKCWKVSYSLWGSRGLTRESVLNFPACTKEQGLVDNCLLKPGACCQVFAFTKV